MPIDTTKLTPQGRLNGPLLRQLRRTQRLTQQDVAKAIGISRPYVARMEASPAKRPRGRQAPPHVLDALAKFFGCEPVDLMLTETGDE